MKWRSYISEFIDSTYVSGNLISIEGYTPDFIAGYEVEEYDLSLEAGRNAKGTMKLNYIGTKYKIVLKTTPLFQEQLKKDRSKTQIVGFSKLNLLEMTRKHMCSNDD